MSDEKRNPRALRGRGWLAGGGVLSGAFALLGASCCVLPILLVNLGVSSALIANLAFFARAREAFMALTLALLAAGVVFALRGARRPRPGFWIALGAGLVLLAAAWIMPHYERELLQWVRPR
jgi:mercuric ion transport protein